MSTHNPRPTVGRIHISGGNVGQVADTLVNNGPFTVGSDAPTRAPAPGTRTAAPAGAAPGTVMSIDVVGSSSGSRAAQHRLDRSLDHVVDDALAESPYRREDWFCRPDGDSVTLVAGAAVGKGWIAADFVRALAIHVRRVNEGFLPSHRLRLRIGIAHGEIEIGPPHVQGAAVRLAARLRDAEPVRRQATQTEAELTLVVSEEFYRDVVCERERDLDPAAFWRFETEVKDGILTGWCRAGAAVGGEPQ